MRRPRRGRALLGGFALVLVLAGCSAGTSASPSPIIPSASDPAATVTGFFAEMNGGGYDRLSTFICAQKKDEIGGKFTPEAQLGKSVGGTMSNAEFAAVWKVAVRNLVVSEVSRSADASVVHVSGEEWLDIDTDKLIDILNELRASDGSHPLSDEEQKQLVEFMSLAEGSNVLDGDMTLSLENGVWLVCSLPGHEIPSA